MRRRPPADAAREQRADVMLADPRRALIWSAVLLTGAAILYGIVWWTAARARLQAVDDAFLRLMVRIRSQPLIDIAKVFAKVGSGVISWTLRALVIAILLRRRHWLHLTAFVLAVATSEALIGPSKAAFDRPRPLGSLIETTNASFPSGHAVAAAVTGVGIVIALLPPGHKRWKWERWAALYASLMAFSRTILGAHWLSDVVAGAFLGSTLALGWPALLVWLRVRRELAKTGEGVDDGAREAVRGGP